MEESHKIDIRNDSHNKYSRNSRHFDDSKLFTSPQNPFDSDPRHNLKTASLMIKINLSKNFNEQQFSVISSLSPEQWISHQQNLYQRICSSKKLYDKFFITFYKNHLTLSNWSLLAVKEKSTL
jgi:hypothetical protein